jgi:MFS family permease
MSSTQPSPSLSAQSKKLMWAAAIGNGLVTYDFTVYSFSAVIIGKLFFPLDSAFPSLLMSLLIFGVGSVMRPIGAMCIGSLADRKGRKIGLTVSNMLMTIGTAIIVLVPTHASIGLMATLLMVLARLMQGFATGGTTGVASVVLMELSPKDHRCYAVCWRSVGQAGAALAGALVGAIATSLLTIDEMQAWGWRVPFILGLLIGPVGWYIRRQMTEAPTVQLKHPRFNRVFSEHGRIIFLGILSMAAPTVGIYIMVYYMPLYLVRTLHMPATIGMLSACISSGMIALFLPVVAKLADRLRLRKPTQYVTTIASIVLVYPCFLLLERGVGEPVSLLIIGIYSALMLSNNAAATVMLLEAFPRHHRATGVSIIYSFGVMIFGAFSPFMVTWLIGVTGSSMAPAWYLMAALGISLFALFRFPETVEEV